MLSTRPPRRQHLQEQSTRLYSLPNTKRRRRFRISSFFTSVGIRTRNLEIVSREGYPLDRGGAHTHRNKVHAYIPSRTPNDEGGSDFSFFSPEIYPLDHSGGHTHRHKVHAFIRPRKKNDEGVSLFFLLFFASVGIRTRSLEIMRRERYPLDYGGAQTHGNKVHAYNRSRTPNDEGASEFPLFLPLLGFELGT